MSAQRAPGGPARGPPRAAPPDDSGPLFWEYGREQAPQAPPQPPKGNWAGAAAVPATQSAARAAQPMRPQAGIHLVFQLGAGDQVDLSTVFVIQAVPAPGAVAGLALVGAGMRRRRRD
jgi:hypothetical protein